MTTTKSNETKEKEVIGLPEKDQQKIIVEEIQRFIKMAKEKGNESFEKWLATSCRGLRIACRASG